MKTRIMVIADSPILLIQKYQHNHTGEKGRSKEKKNDISEAIPNLPIQSYKKNLAFMFKSNKEKQEKETNLL